MFPSRRHRGSIHVVCPPPVRFSSRIVLPALCTSFPLPIVILVTAGIWRPACRHSRSLPSFSRRRESGALPAVLPALYRHSRDGGNLAPCVRRLSIEAPATRYFHGAEPVAVRCGLAMAERTLSTILIRTTRRVWFCGGRIPRIGTDRDLRVFYAYRPCLLYNLAHCERGGNAP